MKLKYKLFLGIVPFTILLLTSIFLYVSARENRNSAEHIHSLFTSALAGLSEFEQRQQESLNLAITILAQDALWRELPNSAEGANLRLNTLQKKLGADFLFFINPNGELQNGNWSGELWNFNELNTNLQGPFLDGQEVKRKTGFLALQGKLYQIALAPIHIGGQTGHVGIGLLFPINKYFRSATGFEVALAGKDGKWNATALALTENDNQLLSNQNGEEISRLQLSGGQYLTKSVKIDPEVPYLRLALLLSTATIDKHPKELQRAMLFIFALGLVLSLTLAGWLARTFSSPLNTIVATIKDLASGGSGTSALNKLTDRKDEIGDVATSLNKIASTLVDELKNKERTLGKLEKYQQQLLELNSRLAKKLFENRVMLKLWTEQARSEDTKDFLSNILEEMLQGLPFSYGCIIIRPLAQIGPEVILARIERTRTGKEEISVTDVLERSDRTLWLSSLTPELKSFLLKMNEESSSNLRLLQEMITAAIEPDTPVRNLTVVSLRLAQGNQHMGSLHFIADKNRFQLNASDEEFLLSVASQVSVVLENRSLQYSTRVDALTRLYNRGYMSDRLREEMLRSSRTAHPFSLLLLDIDHFKQVNDTYGHQAGDEVLVGLAALLKRTCRASDAICRYGGEEIAIILVDTPINGAQIFAENLRQSIAKESFLVPDGNSLHITASMGLAEFPNQAGSMAELIKHADDALYRAKREGRNLWRSFSP